MDLLIWLGPAALSGAALIISMLMVGRRVDLLGEYSVELRRLNFAVQASQEEVSRILEVLTPLSSTLPRLADVNLHLCQLKRQQNGIIEKLNQIDSAKSGSMEDIIEAGMATTISITIACLVIAIIFTAVAERV